jgi:hypothetical protein
MAHNHGSEYQIRVIYEDGTEALSEWIEHEIVAQKLAGLRKPQARAYWLRERNAKVAECPLCRDRTGRCRISLDGLFVSPEPTPRLRLSGVNGFKGSIRVASDAHCRPLNRNCHHHFGRAHTRLGPAARDHPSLPDRAAVKGRCARCPAFSSWRSRLSVAFRDERPRR